MYIKFKMKTGNNNKKEMNNKNYFLHVYQCPHNTGHVENRVIFILGLEISLGLADRMVFYYA